MRCIEVDVKAREKIEHDFGGLCLALLSHILTIEALSSSRLAYARRHLSVILPYSYFHRWSTCETQRIFTQQTRPTGLRITLRDVQLELVLLTTRQSSL